MAPKTRYAHIDFIRAVAIVGVMVTHVLSLHLGPSSINIIWNYIHFTVVGLVFCSAYIYAPTNPKSSTWKFSASWLKKRFLRLYKPFFIYVIAHYLLWLIFPDLLHGYGLKQSIDFFVSSLILTGGVDIGWIPVLFIQLAIISPMLLYISRKPHLNRLSFVLLGLLTLVTTFLRVPEIYSRLLGWIPWSFVLLLGFNYFEMEGNNKTKAKRALILGIPVAGIMWTVLFIILSSTGRSLTLTAHKYPPDLFYLSYGIAMTSLMVLFFPRAIEKVSYISKSISFLSMHSYTLLFVNYIVIDVVSTNTRFSLVWECLIVVFFTVTITALLNLLTTRNITKVG